MRQLLTTVNLKQTQLIQDEAAVNNGEFETDPPKMNVPVLIFRLVYVFLDALSSKFYYFLF